MADLLLSKIYFIFIKNSSHPKIRKRPPIGVIAPNHFIPVIERIYRLPEKIIIPIKKLHPAKEKYSSGWILLSTPIIRMATVWNIWYKTALSYIVLPYSSSISFRPCAPNAPSITTKKPETPPTNKKFTIAPLIIKN